MSTFLSRFNVSNSWQACKKFYEILLVVVDFQVYKIIEKTTFEKFFYDCLLNGSYMKDPHIEADQIGIEMFCSKCQGTGKTDFVKKVMNPPITTSQPTGRVDKYNKVLKFTSQLLNDPHLSSPYAYAFFEKQSISDQNKTLSIYASCPEITDYQNYCDFCYGTGLRLLSSPNFKFKGELEWVI